MITTRALSYSYSAIQPVSFLADSSHELLSNLGLALCLTSNSTLSNFPPHRLFFSFEKPIPRHSFLFSSILTSQHLLTMLSYTGSDVKFS